MATIKDDDYRFLQIADARLAINQRVNLIGVIVETGIPKRSKGTDSFCSLKIVDESYSSPGISVTMFAGSMEKLPRVESNGDIILLSRVLMKTHVGEVNVLYDKRFSSFALFEGRQSTNFVPYQVSPNFRQRDQDKKLIVDLRKWSSDCQLDEGEFLMLREIKVGKLNLLCKVLHICEVSQNKWMVFLWDGTDTPPVNIQTKLEDEMNCPLPLQLEPFPLPRDILVGLPAVGTVLRVIVDQGNEKFGLKLLRTNRWVKFINLTCEVHSGLWCGLLLPFTKLRYLPKDDALITQSERLYDDRLSSKLGRIPFSSFPWCSRVTETDYDIKPFVTLMNVLTYQEVTAKFKCVVRVVAALPWKAEDFRSPLGTYRIRLTLEDPTARIHAFVYAEDGEKLFGGYPSLEVLTRKRNRLLGLAESNGSSEINRNPPWVQCCIKSYYLDKQDMWGSRSYRIFATEVVQ